ncbi:hypothetical protein [Pseudooceanicola nitratireducens]|uniref:hypothetical protein n=1 Tax=Pseudooceanicola nitratireducens TaxID=517719 RepID=UPI003C7B2979
MNSDAKKRFLNDMRAERSFHSPLSQYLNWLRSEGEDGALACASLEADIAELFRTETGLRVLKLMEKSVLYQGIPNGSPDGALREMNAVKNFVLEIRRYVSHG